MYTIADNDNDDDHNVGAHYFYSKQINLDYFYKIVLILKIVLNKKKTVFLLLLFDSNEISLTVSNKHCNFFFKTKFDDYDCR